MSAFVSKRTAKERQVMRNQVNKIMAVCAACFALSAQGQNTPGTAGGTSADPSTPQQGYDSTKHYGATSRMGHQEVRATKIIGAQVKSSQGQTLGTINDVVFNPASGRMDFAVISLSPTSGTESTTSTTTTPSSTSPA